MAQVQAMLMGFTTHSTALLIILTDRKIIIAMPSSRDCDILINCTKCTDLIKVKVRRYLPRSSEIKRNL